MTRFLPTLAALFLPICFLHAAAPALPKIPAVTSALQAAVDRHEVAGAVAIVATPDRILHLGAVGESDLAAHTAMSPDALFWIASMTKPVTATAILMLQDEGKLSVDDPIGKYIPELAHLRTADGVEHVVTLKHLLTHTSGMAEASNEQALAAANLSELVPAFAQPLKFEPGTKWQYCQSGINTLGRIVEIASGQPFQQFLQARLFSPLGMRDTSFYPDSAHLARLAKSYKLAGDQLELAAIPPIYDPARTHRFPAANGGLVSTAPDYIRFGQMLLNKGVFEGKRYLSEAAVEQMTAIQTGEIKTGFTEGNGWGLGCCVVRAPQGVTAALSAGSFGHGGAYGTQFWVDPVKQRIYLLMVQRANFPNSDASDIRRDFQAAAH